MYSQTDLAADLEKALATGFNVSRVSKVAFEIYQEHGLEITSPMERILLTLMAMEEGQEFELTESEVVALIAGIRTM